MSTRRAILKLIGAAPAATAGASASLAAIVASPAIQAASSAAMALQGGIANAPQMPTGLLGATLGRQVDQLLRDLHEERGIAHTLRIGGIDPDILAAQRLMWG